MRIDDRKKRRIDGSVIMNELENGMRKERMRSEEGNTDGVDRDTVDMIR